MRHDSRSFAAHCCLELCRHREILGQLMPDATPTTSSSQRHSARVREFYDAAPTENAGGARAYRALLARYYNLLIPPGASVLEIGCGSGELLSRLRASRKVGVDLSPRQIDAARSRVPDAH